MEVTRQCHDLRYDGEAPAFVVLDRLSYLALDADFHEVARRKGYDPDAQPHIERYLGMPLVVAFADCVFVKVVAAPHAEAMRKALW